MFYELRYFAKDLIGPILFNAEDITNTRDPDLININYIVSISSYQEKEVTYYKLETLKSNYYISKHERDKLILIVNNLNTTNKEEPNLELTNQVVEKVMHRLDNIAERNALWDY